MAVKWERMGIKFFLQAMVKILIAQGLLGHNYYQFLPFSIMDIVQQVILYLLRMIFFGFYDLSFCS